MHRQGIACTSSFDMDLTSAVGQKQGILKGKYHCTVDLQYDWFGISCMTNDILLFLFAKQTNPNQSNRRSMVQWYFFL
jgi:hypothetical protein